MISAKKLNNLNARNSHKLFGLGKSKVVFFVSIAVLEERHAKEVAENQTTTVLFTTTGELRKIFKNLPHNF